MPSFGLPAPSFAALLADPEGRPLGLPGLGQDQVSACQHVHTDGGRLTVMKAMTVLMYTQMMAVLR